jgi:cobalt-zinc-cadmium resistance protein CzcA
MINKLIAFCLQQRLLVIGAATLLAVVGIISFERLPILAFPDVQNVFVQVVTLYSGQAPEEVEKLISLPIGKEMNGLLHLTNMRSVSIFGLSVVTLTGRLFIPATGIGTFTRGKFTRWRESVYRTVIHRRG